jgi:ELWxxDGT repeat protein
MAKSDGTTPGTTLVKDINPGPAGSLPYALTAVDGALYLNATDPDHGAELWTSDGTAAGTRLVEDINARRLIGDVTRISAVIGCRPRPH